MQPLRGAQPPSGAALEDSELRGDISSQAASSCKLETMEQRVMRKEHFTVMHPALSSVPFGFVKISDVFQSWVHQTFSCSCAKRSSAPQNPAQQTVLGSSPLPLNNNNSTEPHMAKPHCSHRIPHTLPSPFVPGALVESRDLCPQDIMTWIIVIRLSEEN